MCVWGGGGQRINYTLPPELAHSQGTGTLRHRALSTSGSSSNRDVARGLRSDAMAGDDNGKEPLGRACLLKGAADVLSVQKRASSKRTFITTWFVH